MMSNPIGTYALVHHDADGYSVKIHASTGRVRKVVLTGQPTSQDARNAWAGNSQSTKVPILYGRHVVAADEEGRAKHAISWGRMNGLAYRMTEKFWYAKEGDGLTMSVSARRGVADGYVWATRRVVDPKDKFAVIARAIRSNAEAGDTPSVVSDKKKESRIGFFTSSDREATNVEQWVA